MPNFIDYVSLLLINMVGGLFVLACFLGWGLKSSERKHWAPAFAISGLIATFAGLAMVLTSPIPKPFSMAFGEMSVLLGVLFLGAAWALANGWSLVPLGLYALFPGAAAIVLGARIIHLSLTGAPLLAGIGFIITGCGGVFAALLLWLQRIKALRIIAAVVMFAAAVLWAPTAYTAYWLHMQVNPSQPGDTAQQIERP